MRLVHTRMSSHWSITRLEIRSWELRGCKLTQVDAPRGANCDQHLPDS